MGMNVTKELKLTYKFKWEKMSPQRVNIDPLEGNVAVDLKKHRALIPY
jgi:hypothetical protein